ncbi:hypothetical protein [Sphingomonas sp. CROZ-RG-20F-R02-07]|uniref:hypothetical protein n=1 Tax=Sphingomonas sp. CROZ-RG-20F-R02-07 TaxID=2914832 RepID=UPI001F594BE6|nr:hypothetical protein [Sphingomonas sp. CROZ-RG-20F-R02-07]
MAAVDRLAVDTAANRAKYLEWRVLSISVSPNQPLFGGYFSGARCGEGGARRASGPSCTGRMSAVGVAKFHFPANGSTIFQKFE